METLFWKRLKELCVANNTTPTAVCKATGLSTGSVTNWKRGSIGTPPVREKLAEYFGVDPAIFVGAEEKEKAPTEGATDEEVKFALFGTTAVSDDLYERVKQMARIAAEMEAREKGG